MFSRRAFVQLAGASATAIGLPAHSKSPVSARRAEAAALIRFAEQTHPRGLEARADKGWRSLAASLEAGAASGSVAQFIVRAFALLSWFQDGHTTLWAGQLTAGPFGLQLPISVGAFHDGMRVIAAAPDLADLLGATVTDVAEVKTEDVIRRFAAIWPKNNPAWAHHDSPLLFSTPGLLHGLRILRGPGDASISLGTSAGRRSIAPGKAFERRALARPQSRVELWRAGASSGNFIRRLPERSALYVSIDDISQPVGAFLPFVQQLFGAMEEPAWSKLIIDLRRNGGGNNFLIEPIRKHIERSRFNRPGALYVLTSPVTFSAAQNFVNRLERETFAIFAGEPTGGAPNHYGDAKTFPGTILHGGVSTVPWFDSYPMDRRQWVMPDLLIPRTFADWAAGRDPALDAVLADESAGPANDIVRDRIFYWNRKSQAAPWKPFWMA